MCTVKGRRHVVKFFLQHVAFFENNRFTISPSERGSASVKKRQTSKKFATGQDVAKQSAGVAPEVNVRITKTRKYAKGILCLLSSKN